MTSEMSRAYDIRVPRGVQLTDTTLAITRAIGQDEFEQLLGTLVRVEPYRTHTLVAAMDPDDQRLWLARARKWGWTSTELQEQVRASRGAEADTEEDAFRKPSTHADFKCPNCGWAWTGQPYVRRGTA